MALIVCVAIAGCPKKDTKKTGTQAGGGKSLISKDKEETPTDPGIRLTQQTLDFEFVYRNDEAAGKFAILESLGGGIGVIDFDNDDYPDVLIPGGGHYPAEKTIAGFDSALLRNVRGQLVECAEVAGVASSPFYSHGAAVCDFDNDGFADVLITGFGGLTLYHNNGDGTFAFVPSENSGLTDSLWSSSAAWGDFNGDGNSDLYVAHYTNWSFENDPVCMASPNEREVCPPREYDPLPDVIYFSNGDGSFSDATQTAGLRPDGKGLGVLAGDVDNDGDVDLYVANDTVDNFLYRNNGDGTFEDYSLTSGTSLSATGVPDGSMGVDLCDFNNDGWPDLWVANYERESFGLYQNLGKDQCLFRHVSQKTGVAAIGGLYVGWGTVFIDFENDGDQDAFVSNGHVIRHPVNAPLKQQPLVLMNRNAGERLVNITDSTGDYSTASHMGRGMASVDLNNDAKVDVVISHVNEPIAVLHNESKSAAAALRLKLIPVSGNRSGIGTRVVLKSGDQLQSRQIIGGGSYASTHEAVVHFGLGDQSQADEVSVMWPDGSEQSLDNVSPGEFVIVQGHALLAQP